MSQDSYYSRGSQSVVHGAPSTALEPDRNGNAQDVPQTYWVWNSESRAGDLVPQALPVLLMWAKPWGLVSNHGQVVLLPLSLCVTVTWGAFNTCRFRTSTPEISFNWIMMGPRVSGWFNTRVLKHFSILKKEQSGKTVLSIVESLRGRGGMVLVSWFKLEMFNMFITLTLK